MTTPRTPASRGRRAQSVPAEPGHTAERHFEGWSLHPASRQLLVKGTPVPLGRRAFDLLHALANRPGDVLSKDDLLQAAWPGLVVEENNISVQVTGLRKLLGPQAIDTVPGLGYRLTAKALRPGRPSDTVPVTTAPYAAQPTVPAGLFGRADDLAEVLAAMQSTSLVTITGTGGIGKTSLAHAAVAGWTDAHAGLQVHWIDLAPLHDGGQLASRLAQALGVQHRLDSALGDLLAALSQIRCLVVLDNCEHLLAPVEQLVGPALQRAPGVRWLATSQAPLRLPGERVHRLRPLGLPSPSASLDDAASCPALALLCHRASAAGTALHLTDANLTTAIDLCQQLDGLPLAIEIAASQVSLLGLDSVHRQLAQRLHMHDVRRPGPLRHHSLRNLFDWSYRLLTPEEQRLFRHLEPFESGFDTGMAIGLLATDGVAAMPPWQTMQALGALVDKSLVHRMSDTASRCFLPESAREYARAMQAEVGDMPQVKLCHASAVAQAFATARVDHDRLRDAEWSARYAVERHNVRAALDWACRAGTPDLLARLVAALAQIDTFARNPAEIVHLPVPLHQLDQAEPALRAAAKVELAWAHFLDGSRILGTTLAEAALADFQAIGDPVGTYQALAQLVRLYEARPGQIDKARQALAMLRRIDERHVPLKLRLFCAIGAGLQYQGGRDMLRMQAWHDTASRAGFDMLAAVCRAHITDELLIQGRFDDVVAHADKYLAAGERCPRVDAIIRFNQILARVQLGQTAQAARQAPDVLRTMPSLAYLMVGAFALAAAREGRHADAALMAGYCERVRRDRDQWFDPAEAAAAAETSDLLARALDADTLRELLQMGAALSQDEAWAMLSAA